MMKADTILTEQVSFVADEYLTNSIQRYNEKMKSDYVRKQMISLRDDNDSYSITNGKECSNSISFSSNYVRKKMIFG